MYLLAVAAVRTNVRSFEGIARQLFPGGKRAFSYWVAFIRWFYSFGACVGYVISVGDCLTPIFAEAHRRQPDNKAIAYFDSTSGRRLLMSLIWLCIMLPLVIPKHIDSLRYASAFAVACMSYFVVVIIVHSSIHGLPEHKHNLILSGNQNEDEPGPNIYFFRTGNSALSGLGVYCFAYVCQINAMEALWDMRPEVRSVKNFTIASFIGMMICGTLYVLVSVFGYFDFGSEDLASNSILRMYNPLSEPEVMLAYVGVLVKLCVSYALLSIASRNAIYYVIGWQTRYRVPRLKRRKLNDEEVGNQNGEMQEMEDFQKVKDSSNMPVDVDDGELVNVENNQFVDNIPFWQHLLVVVILAAVKLLCGLFVPNIRIVFGFTGAISGGFLGFIFPSLFCMYSGNFTLREVGWFNYIMTYLLLICGVIAVVFGTGATIYSTATDS
ncbi:amino acid permease [Angomonas deanei]|nr:amino acid permease [Angomonas deanei]|eukprot:EPY32169.1 amino acid permease [Angomonas deanei]